MNQVHRSLFYSAVERYGGFLLAIISSAVLARLLMPDEFGAFAVINAIVAVINASYQEFGGGNYLIQKTSLTERSIRTAFTVTFCISLMIGVLLLLVSGALASFFRQEELKSGIEVVALNFVILPFSGTISALLRREMKFGGLVVCTLAAGIVSMVVSIVLAVMGYSFLSLLWGGVAGNIALTLFLFAWFSDLRIFRPSLSGYREVIRFGLYSSGASVINVFYNLSPQLFLARNLDFAAVGLYSRAVGATQVFDKLIGQVLTPVILPAVFAQIKAGGDLKRIYLDAVGLLSAVHWPFLAFMAIMAQPIIVIWLGPAWADAVPLVRILCVASLSMFAACLTYPMLVAVGRVKDALVSSLITLPPSLLVILGASFFGVEAVAAASLVTLPFQVVVAVYYVSRHLKIGAIEFIGALWRSGVVMLCSCIGALACAVMVESHIVNPGVGLTIAFFSTAIGWWTGLVLTEHPLLLQLKSVVAGLSLPFHFSVKMKPAVSDSDVNRA